MKRIITFTPRADAEQAEAIERELSQRIYWLRNIHERPRDFFQPINAMSYFSCKLQCLHLNFTYDDVRQSCKLHRVITLGVFVCTLFGRNMT